MAKKTVIKLNTDLKGYKAGEEIILEEKSFKEQIYWLRRLEEAKIDKCCEILEEKKEKTKSKQNVIQ